MRQREDQETEQIQRQRQWTTSDLSLAVILPENPMILCADDNWWGPSRSCSFYVVNLFRSSWPSSSFSSVVLLTCDACAFIPLTGRNPPRKSDDSVCWWQLMIRSCWWWRRAQIWQIVVFPHLSKTNKTNANRQGRNGRDMRMVGTQEKDAQWMARERKRDKQGITQQAVEEEDGPRSDRWRSDRLKREWTVHCPPPPPPPPTHHHHHHHHQQQQQQQQPEELTPSLPQAAQVLWLARQNQSV